MHTYTKQYANTHLVCMKEMNEKMKERMIRGTRLMVKLLAVSVNPSGKETGDHVATETLFCLVSGTPSLAVDHNIAL